MRGGRSEIWLQCYYKCLQYDSSLFHYQFLGILAEIFSKKCNAKLSLPVSLVVPILCFPNIINYSFRGNPVRNREKKSLQQICNNGKASSTNLFWLDNDDRIGLFLFLFWNCFFLQWRANHTSRKSGHPCTFNRDR